MTPDDVKAIIERRLAENSEIGWSVDVQQMGETSAQAVMEKTCSPPRELSGSADFVAFTMFAERVRFTTIMLFDEANILFLTDNVIRLSRHGAPEAPAS